MEANSITQPSDEDAFALIDILGEGIVVWRDGQILYANARVLEFLGYDDVKPGPVASQKMLERLNFNGKILQPDLDIVRENYHRRMAGEPTADRYEFRIQRDDGTVAWISCRSQRVTWQGKPAIAACLYDVTERQLATIARRNSEELFRNIFRLTPEVMVLSNMKDQKIIDVNPAFLNIFGKRRDDVIGKTTQDLGIWADPTFFSRFTEELKISASLTDVPTTVRTRGNVIRHFRLFAQKIEQNGENLLLSTCRDVTEDLVRAQELQRSRDSAELANRAKSEFLANMSHELRTPLNAILGFAEIIREEMLGPIGVARYSEYAGDIHESGTHLLEIINDVLDLSKVEAGRLEAHLTWISPEESLEMCVTLVQQRAYEANLTLEHRFERSVLLEADERLVKQIALNLLSNAIKFTEPGGRVTICLEKTGTGGLCLTVDDTGIGMTPEEIKVAKRPFGQVDSSLSRRHEGSGLGLPLISAFAEKLSATMTIDSQPGVGTRVSVVFPPFKVKEKPQDD